VSLILIICNSEAVSMFYAGTFNELDHHQIAALASCFIQCDKSSEQVHLTNELVKPLRQLQDSARLIAQVILCTT